MLHKSRKERIDYVTGNTWTIKYLHLLKVEKWVEKVPPFFDSPTLQPVMVYPDVDRALQNTVHQVALPTYDRLKLRRLVQTSERTMRDACYTRKADRR